VQQFGSFTAHEVLKKLRADNRKDYLDIFHQKRRDQRHEHSVWQDVQAKNVLGKEDTMATVQVDFYSAKKFDLNFINEKGEKEHPVIVHRAIMGSFDRFFAFLTEYTGGNFPVWLSPVQALIIPVGEKFNDYGEKVLRKLKSAGVRAEMDKSNETLGKKIRAGKTKKIPYLLVVGEKEKEAETVAVNFRDKKEQETMPIKQFAELIQKEIVEKK